MSTSHIMQGTSGCPTCHSQLTKLPDDKQAAIPFHRGRDVQRCILVSFRLAGCLSVPNGPCTANYNYLNRTSSPVLKAHRGKHGNSALVIIPSPCHVTSAAHISGARRESCLPFLAATGLLISASYVRDFGLALDLPL